MTMRKNKHTADLAFHLLTGLLSVYFVYLVFKLNGECKLCRLQYLFDGSAVKPFQYRMLIPWILQLLSKSAGVRPMSILVTLNVLLLYLIVFIYRYFLSLFVDNRHISGYLALGLFFILPFHNLFARELPIWYPWDFSTLLFFLLGIIAVYRKNWLLYYPVFIIGTFNKETTCFLPFLYFYAFLGREKIRSLLLHPAASLLLWLGIKMLMHQLYPESGASVSFFQVKITTNIEYLTRLPHILMISSLFGFLWLPVLLLFHHIKEIFIRRSLFVVLIYSIGMFYVGNVYELRIFNEMIPLVLTAFYLAVYDLSKSPDGSADLPPLSET